MTRVEPPLAGDEIATMLGSLDRQRATLAWKCGDLDSVGLNATLPPSRVTLGGLLTHLAHIEDESFVVKLLGREPSAPWDTADWVADPDWDWDTSRTRSPTELMAFWERAVEHSRAIVAEALSHGGLDQLGAFVNARGESPSLRRILIDLIEEYARHVGHADLIRESIDGLTGEDPPG